MRFGWIFLLIGFVFTHITGYTAPAKDHEIWWEKSLGVTVPISTFRQWLGGSDEPSRMAMRRHVKEMGYKSILDAAAGLCIDYWGFLGDGYGIEYMGVDITPKLVSAAKRLNIPIVEGSIESLPFTDHSFDLCYGRHILEHLSGYETALLEMIRVAKKEVLVVFFIKPSDSDRIDLSIRNDYLLYHNVYSKQQIETFLLQHPKVMDCSWQEVNAQECILHLYLRTDCYE